MMGRKDAVVQQPLTAVIVGSGFGGIGMAIRLRQAGITDFVLLEKSDRIGGTWRDNTYPGAACDVPSPLYSFSFEQDFDWPRFYSAQHDIHRYQQHCVDKYGLMPHVRLNTEVRRAWFDESSGLWKVETSQGDTVAARAFITATGQLNRPAVPDIPGLATFGGKVFHSSRWDHTHDLAGKRVGIVGTGASAIQFLAHVAERGDRVTLFQRTAPYVLPKPDRRITRAEHWLHRKVPALRKLVRGAVYTVFETLGVGLLKFRPVLAPLMGLWRLHLRLTIKNPALRAKLTPDYAIGCKRILFDNTYYRALARPNVEVVTSGIREVGEGHVVTQDGIRHELDTLILGTGFAASGFLAPMEVRGRGGRELRASWRDGAEAYLGITVSGFPNLFMLYGPNTNLGHNSIVYMLESQIRYIKEAIVRLRAAPGTAFDVRSDVQSGFNKKLQHSLRNTVWAAGCKSWYIAESGKIVNNWGGFTFSYRRLTRRFDPVNYQAIAAKSAAPISEDLVIRESSVTKLARLAVKTCLKPALRPALPVAVQRRWAAIATRTLSVPFGVHFSRSTMAGVPVETVRSKSKAPKAESAVLFLHGGAFVLGSPVSHRSITGRLARYSGVPVFVPDYRLAPEHPFPAALDDALACYRALLERGYAPERIAVAGDSAGGGLALSLCLRLRSEGLTQPACLALISPWADLTLSQLASIADDALLRDSWLQQGARAYLRGRAAREPLVSPLLADLAGLPPTLIQAGSEEILRNDSRRLAQAMTAVGVFVVHREFARMWHDFQLYAGVVPEATAAIDEIARFVDSNASRPLARQPKHEQQRLDVPDDALMSRALPASGN